jgi:hypothetical protein
MRSLLTHELVEARVTKARHCNYVCHVQLCYAEFYRIELCHVELAEA